jgi:hypothetical protein
MFTFFRKQKTVLESIDIGWVGLCNLYPLATVFPPEPFQYHSDIQGSSFIKCPATREFVRNTYIIRTPIDFTFSKNDQGITVIDTYPEQYSETLSNNYLESARIQGCPITQTPMDMGIISDIEDVIIEIMPIPLQHHKYGHAVVSGRFNCYNWPARNISASFEWYDTSVPVSYKRGDAVFAIRFSHPDNPKINLRPCRLTEPVRKVLYDIGVIKNGFSKNTQQMMKNYKNLRNKKLIEWL